MAIRGRTVLAVIPARSGSKRCPGKNFRDFRGVPLWEWSVMRAKESAYIDRWIVSRDEDRTPELCTDEATNEDVLRHHLAALPHDWVVLLQPTSPLRSAADIDGCIERALSNGSAALTVNERGQKNGAVYVASAAWIAEHDFTHAGYAKYIMDDERSLDIDWEHQFNE